MLLVTLIIRYPSGGRSKLLTNISNAQGAFHQAECKIFMINYADCGFDLHFKLRHQSLQTRRTPEWDTDFLDVIASLDLRV